MTIRVVVSPEDGELLHAEAMALLLGVPVDQIRVHRTFNGTDIMTLPPEWMRSGRSRSNEAQAHGRTDMVGAMTYWSKKNHSSDLVIEYTDVPAGGAE